MKRTWPQAALAAALLIFCRVAAADQPGAADRQRLFEEGNRAYLEGDYAAAVEKYRQVAESGPLSADLAYNLANAYFRQGKKGLAILFYERALRLRPGDEAALANLAMARKSLVDRVVMPSGGNSDEPPWQEFVRSFSLDAVTLVFSGLWVLVFALAIVRRLSGNAQLKRQLFWLNLPLATLLLLAGLFFFASWYVNERLRYGVIVAPLAELREGPDGAARVQMEVHEGLKVKLLQESGDFVRVRLANGVEGYVRSDRIGEI